MEVGEERTGRMKRDGVRDREREVGGNALRKVEEEGRRGVRVGRRGRHRLRQGSSQEAL